MPDDLAVLDAILHKRLGLDRASVGSGLVLRAARTRMRATGLVELPAYAELVGSSEVELQALIDEVVVPESWFFRDRLPFDLLQRLAREGWTARPKREPLRILSIPCAGGEEPYSMAVTLHDAGLAPRRFHIDAVDVSAARLDYARRGVYSRNGLRGVEPERLTRWFHQKSDGFEIDASIRTLVHFHLGNLLDDRLLADVPKYDFVFCRNLLIYLTRDARAKAEANLDRLLAPDGVLVLGHADVLGASAVGRAFVATGGRGAFAASRRKPSAPPSHATPVWNWNTAAIPPTTTRPPALPARPPAPVRTNSPPSVAAPPAFAAPSPPPSEDPRPLLEQAMEHANQGRHGQALACCEREIRRAGPSAPAYFLMGVIHQAAGRRSEAEADFHKAVYLDPSHDEALLALALLADRRGDRDSAVGFRRRADRALKTKAGSADTRGNPMTRTGGPNDE